MSFAKSPPEFDSGECTFLNFDSTDDYLNVMISEERSPALTNSEAVTIRVNEVNQNPIIDVGPSVWDIPEDAYASRSYLITDPEGQEVTVSLDANAQALGFGILNINNPVVNKLIFWTAPLEVSEETFDVTVTATDEVGGSTDFVITINIEEVNQSPVLMAFGDQSVDEHSELAFTIAATDGDLPAQNISYSISSGLLPGMSLNENTGAFSWTPSETQNGDHIITLVATDDGEGMLSDSETITITVNEVNVAPVLASIGDQSVDEETTLNFTVTASDVDIPFNSLRYTLDRSSGRTGMSIDVSTGEFSWIPSEEQDGDYTVTITVFDDDMGMSGDSETITISVSEVNQPPLLDPISDQSAFSDELLTFNVTGSDTDLPANTLTYSLDATSVGLGMTIDATNGEFNWTPTSADSGTENSVTVTLSDGFLTDEVTFKVSVDKEDQTITFASIADKTFGGDVFDLSASASSGLTVAYNSSDLGVATISGSTVTIVGAGTTTITATQTGSTSYKAAEPVTQSLTVQKASQSISFPTLATKIFGDDSFDIDATATSGLEVSFASSNAEVATVADNTLTIIGAGTTTITATQDGDDNYEAAIGRMQELVVTKANLMVTANKQSRVYNEENPTLTISYGGFIGSDTEAGLDVAPTASTTADLNSDVGAYPIAASGGMDNNYSFTFVEGTLTITQAEATITLADLEQQADGSEKTPTVTTDPEELDFTITYDGSEEAPSAEGDYELVVTIDELNYTGSTTGTFEIIAEEVPLSVDNQQKVLIYPNPATDRTIVTGPVGAMVELIDLSGVRMFAMQLEQQTIWLDLRDVAPGIYLLRWVNNGSIEHLERVIIKR